MTLNDTELSLVRKQQVSIVATLWAFIMEVLDSNPGGDTGYPD